MVFKKIGATFALAVAAAAMAISAAASHSDAAGTGVNSSERSAIVQAYLTKYSADEPARRCKQEYEQCKTNSDCCGSMTDPAP
jgi:hypothetical protein